MTVRVFQSMADLAKSLVAHIKKYSDECIRERGAFNLVLSGGSLISLLLEGNMQSLCGKNWRVFLADERYVPLDSQESNYGLIKKNLAGPWFNDADFLPLNVNGPVDVCAKEYADRMAGVCFDLVLLGLGPDGHTASLFPPFTSTAHLAAAFPVYNSPKPPPTRVSMSMERLANSNQIIFVVTGESKASAVKAIIEEKDPSLPPTHLLPHANWLLDSLAASLLPVELLNQNQ